MPTSKKLKPDDPEQSKRFKETARELEADENGKLFERALGILPIPKGVESAKQEAPRNPKKQRPQGT
jgi:hypothetical protein